jgi:hypothetical protein
MPAPKRDRSDSVAAAVDAALSVSMPDLVPPAFVTLSELGRQFWPGIIHARAREEWRAVDLVVAAQLAECQALIETESAYLREEGMIVKNDRGTQIENPRNKVVQTLATREMALMRTLLMGGKDGGDARNFKGVRALESEARKTAAQLKQEREDEELLS